MKTILVVDDEEAMLSLVRDALTLAGHEVLTAGGGAAALELEQTHTEPLISCSPTS